MDKDSREWLAKHQDERDAAVEIRMMQKQQRLETASKRN